jgi:hypothetical protein
VTGERVMEGEGEGGVCRAGFVCSLGLGFGWRWGGMIVV